MKKTGLFAISIVIAAALSGCGKNETLQTVKPAGTAVSATAAVQEKKSDSTTVKTEEEKTHTITITTDAASVKSENNLAQPIPVEHPISDVEDVARRDGLHCADDIVHVFDRVAHEERARGAQEFVHAALIAQGDLSDELLFGVLQLHGAESLLAEFVQFLVDQPNGFHQRVGVDTHLDVDEAGVGIGRVLRLDAVGEAVFLADVEPEAGAHGRTAQHVVEHHDGHPQRTAKLGCDAAYEAVTQVVLAFRRVIHGGVMLEGLAFLINKVGRLLAEIFLG